MKVEKKLSHYSLVNSQHLMQLLFSFDQDTRVEKLSYKRSLVNSHHATLMQLLLLSNQDIRVEITLIDSHKLSLVNFQQLSCKSCSRLTQNARVETLINSCSRLTRTRKLRKLWYKLSLVNSYATRLTRTWELRKLSIKLSLVNSHKLSCNSCFLDQDIRVEKTLIQILACQLSELKKAI